MGLTVNNNVAALNAYRNLSNTQNDLGKSLEKLSSGLRINRAADDAAGLAISEGLRSQIGGLTVASRNAQDGISVVQTAEGALTEVHSILQRLRDLGVQAANDSNNADARTAIETEASSLVDELGRISKSTNFNGTNLLDGTAGTLKFQVGAGSGTDSQISVDLSSANISTIAQTLTTGALATTGTEFAVTTGSLTNGTYSFDVDNGSGVTSTIAVDLSGGAAPTSVQDLADKLSADANFAANFSVSVVKDADGAATGISVKALNGGSVGVTAPGAGIAAGTAGTSSPIGLDFSSADAAQASIDMIDSQIKTVSTARANLGAYQNRLEHTIKNVNVAIENLTASESRIRDTDMASEMVNYTSANILSQAGTAMLAQAKSLPQGVLQLLQG
ncbi:flagellin N-terminal helical domain-containing protein [Demequina iriomotensis]|uniref:flagellin N-terminal helical domain-containing protein n=1 Tax=Demequina iriomotensis TaxID=1536641 RepID=UPI000786419D|nr:flagellin [Demequina iriomotensis]